MPWIPIRYREFYDVPRALLVEWGGVTYFFDCSFDERADDYPDHYLVYRLGRPAAAVADSASWVDLAQGALFVGAVAVTTVQFDPTRRAAIDDAVFGVLEAQVSTHPPPAD